MRLLALTPPDTASCWTPADDVAALEQGLDCTGRCTPGLQRRDVVGTTGRAEMTD